MRTFKDVYGLDKFLTTKSGTEFLLEKESQSDFQITIIIHRVVNHSDGEPRDWDQYIKAYIKGDWCTHFWFGSSDGYLHLCGQGEGDVLELNEVMVAIIEYAKKNLERLNEK